MMKHALITAAATLVLTIGALGVATEDAVARGGGMMWPQGGWHGGVGGGWHGGGGNWHGGGGNWHGGGWGGGGHWHGGGGNWHGGGWHGGCWNCGGWGGGGWGWGWGPAVGFGLGYGIGAWDYGPTRVCDPVFRPVKVRTSHGWRWRDVYVGRHCYWTNSW